MVTRWSVCKDGICGRWQRTMQNRCRVGPMSWSLGKDWVWRGLWWCTQNASRVVIQFWFWCERRTPVSKFRCVWSLWTATINFTSRIQQYPQKFSIWCSHPSKLPHKATHLRPILLIYTCWALEQPLLYILKLPCSTPISSRSHVSK